MSRPDWDTDGQDWPNRDASRFVRAGGILWHVQVMGQGPPVLLLHGTGAATHSWAGLLPLLAQDFTVVAPDLPGHGFTEAAPDARMSLPGMAWGLQHLLRALAIEPVLGVGHSAGAAILARMALDGPLLQRGIVSLNGALVPLRGGPGDLPIFATIARALVSVPVIPWLFSWRAGDPRVVDRLLAGTGSRIDATQAALYARLVRRSGHVSAALAMMANWDLKTLSRDLPRLAAPLTLVVGENDRTIPPGDVLRVQALLPAATIERLPALGHLAHEERPDLVAAIVAHAALA
jgi:magnesium chelatase accessory protein